MQKLAFSVAGVSASALGGTTSSKFAHFALRRDGQLTSIVEIVQEGDESFGALENKIIHYGSMRCCTARGGERMGADPEGRAMPELLLFKHIDITVDCGRITTGVGSVLVNLEISEGLGRVKGPTLYKLEDAEMRIWSGTLTADCTIRGYARPVGGSNVDRLVDRLFAGTVFEPEPA